MGKVRSVLLACVFLFMGNSLAVAATAVVVVTGTNINGTNAVMNYNVVILDSPNPPKALSSDYTINPAQTVLQNVAAWKNKIVADVANQGVTITVANIILWGE